MNIENLKAEIKGLINPEIMEKHLKNNNDPYGAACVKVAVNVMKYLDTFDDDFNIGYNPDMTTPHGIICHCDDQGGITGFMEGMVRNIVALCHALGWKFYIADCISMYDIEHQERIDKVISNACNTEGLNVTKEEVPTIQKN